MKGISNNPTPLTMDSNKAAFSIPSIISIAAGIGTFATGAFWGIVLACVAIVFGLIGVALALSPRTRGGLFSILGVLGGLIGIVAAIFKLFF